jgi:hypothetical protein
LLDDLRVPLGPPAGDVAAQRSSVSSSCSTLSTPSMELRENSLELRSTGCIWPSRTGNGHLDFLVDRGECFPTARSHAAVAAAQVCEGKRLLTGGVIGRSAAAACYREQRRRGALRSRREPISLRGAPQPCAALRTVSRSLIPQHRNPAPA